LNKCGFTVITNYFEDNLTFRTLVTRKNH
jgi:hypothetical protein